MADTWVWVDLLVHSFIPLLLSYMKSFLNIAVTKSTADLFEKSSGVEKGRNKVFQGEQGQRRKNPKNVRLLNINLFIVVSCYFNFSLSFKVVFSRSKIEIGKENFFSALNSEKQ